MNDWKLRLKQAREAKELNKTEFARLVGVSNATVTDWEKSAEIGGIKELSAPSLAKISQILEVDPHWIMSGKLSKDARPPDHPKPKPVQVVEPKFTLQWVSDDESVLLDEYRALAEAEKLAAVRIVRSLERAIVRPVTDKSQLDRIARRKDVGQG